MASATIYILLLAVIGCCCAQKQSKCAPNEASKQNAQGCFEEFKTKKDEIPKEEQKDWILFCIATKEGILKNDGTAFDKDAALESIENTDNTDEIKEQLKAVIEKCCTEHDPETEARSILKCVMPGMMQVCKPEKAQ